MNNSNTPLIASEEVRKNFIKSFILVAVVAALVIAASWYLGDLLGDVKTGLLIGGIVVAVVLPPTTWITLAALPVRRPMASATMRYFSDRLS